MQSSSRDSGFGIRASALVVLSLSFAIGVATSAQRGANTATWFEGARLIVGDGNTIENAVWSYEHPFDEVKQIGGYLAFYPRKVDRIEVD